MRFQDLLSQPERSGGVLESSRRSWRPSEPRRQKGLRLARDPPLPRLAGSPAPKRAASRLTASLDLSS